MATTTANAKLRYNEYYGQQSTFDELYKRSLNGAKFNKLYGKIVDEGNILLAYRNIKSNTGGATKGTDGKTIQDIAKMTNERMIGLLAEGATIQCVPLNIVNQSRFTSTIRTQQAIDRCLLDP